MTLYNPKITVKLPPLDAYGALLLDDLLESIIAALWRTHGDQMADIRARQGIDTPAPQDAVYCANPPAARDSDFEF